MSSKQFTSLSLNKQKPLQSKEVQNVFGDEDSNDESSKPQTSAEKFHSKFGNLKARDDRAVQKVLEENPDIYDYDGAYDSIQEKRNRIEEEKETKRKVDKNAKYTDKLLDAKKKRDLEKLLRDERKQEKERVAEGEEFKDKETFVTGAYRKQLEETVKFRKELEESDRYDDLTAVAGQKMWRENFNKNMLDAKVRGRFLDTEEDEEDKKPVKIEACESPERQIKKEKRHEEKRRDRSRDRDDDSKRHHKDRKRDRDSCDRRDRSPENRRHGHKESSRKRRGSSSSDDGRKKSRRDYDRKYDRHHKDSRERHHRDSRDKRERSPDDRHKKSKRDEKISLKEQERLERKKRMEAIRSILKLRNDSKQVEEAKQRYLKRREAGLIVPPV